MSSLSPEVVREMLTSDLIIHMVISMQPSKYINPGYQAEITQAMADEIDRRIPKESNDK